MSSTIDPAQSLPPPPAQDPIFTPPNGGPGSGTGKGTATDPNLHEPIAIIPHVGGFGGPGPVITPGFIFLHAVPDPLGDVTKTAIGYYPLFAAQTTPTSGVPTQLVVVSQGPVTMKQQGFEGKEEFVVFEKTAENKFGTQGKFSWIIFDDASTQLKDSIVGAAKLVHDDFTRTFAMKKDDGHLVFEEDGWNYSAVYYCE